MDFYQEKEKLILKNNRIFNSSDASSHYYELVAHSKVDEDLAYSLNRFFEKLQLSAAEMWICSYEWSLNWTTKSEIQTFEDLLHTGIENNGYMSEELISNLIEVFQYVQEKYRKKNATKLEYHLYMSLSKELFCYRKGHKLLEKSKL